MSDDTILPHWKRLRVLLGSVPLIAKEKAATQLMPTARALFDQIRSDQTALDNSWPYSSAEGSGFNVQAALRFDRFQTGSGYVAAANKIISAVLVL